jgi:hypothetical protein
VYLVMISGLFALTFMTAARQALPIVARYEVWAGQLDASERKQILGGNGTYQVTDQQSSQTPLSVEKLLDELPMDGKQQLHQPMARAILGNELEGGTAPYERRTLTVEFTYHGLQILGLEGAMPVFSTDASTYVALPHTRAVHTPGNQDHFAEKGDFRPGDVQAGDVPSQNRYLPPKQAHFDNDGPSPGQDPGIWDIHARIDGSERKERDLIGGVVKRGN